MPKTDDVPEHILEIRQHIKASETLQISSQDKFFDSVTFWQKAYEASEAEQAKLLNTIHDLEQRNQGLLSRLRTEPSASDDKHISGKRMSAGVNKASRESKKSKSNTRRSKATSKAPEVERNRAQDAQEESNSTRLMRQIFVLQRAIQKRQKYSSLATEAVILCKEAEREILLAVQRPETFSDSEISLLADPDRDPDLVTVIKSVEMSFDLAHNALQKLQNDESCETYKSQVVYYLVCLFESTMTALAQYCAKVDDNQRNSNLEPPPASAKSRRKEKAKTTQKSSCSNSKIAECFTSLLCTMTLSLDLRRCDDGKIMEGILCISTSRLGKILALFTFGDNRKPAICSEMGRLNETMAMKTLPTKNIQLEAKHLISFLETALFHSSRSIWLNETEQSQFFHNAKDRLQKTLLKAVFGSNEPSFQGSLRVPETPPPQDCSPTSSEQAEFPEWFTQKLWRLVGWDLLITMTKGGLKTAP
ncbi:hypothetical protein N7492_010593 [Penicillium capsulatum]|uniref:Uncharacterized protein n=1 Tax=Penicillium capsulatum TaxID=69766 RepID=A0A9W9HLG8_9EURO|nr:hypothetical protein N7492_010593 [Penicillium capsulatum]KAJ6113092.1 hypothetical protein N7512_008416 [Penicillium capsulatum]